MLYADKADLTTLFQENWFGTDSMKYRKVFPAGSAIFTQGQVRDCAYIIEYGSVEISSIQENQHQVLVVLNEGEIFGETALIKSGASSATAVALEETSVYIIKPELIREKLKDIDPVIDMFVKILVERFSQLRKAVGHIKQSHPELLREHHEPYSLQHNGALEQLKFEREIQLALQREELRLHLQPMVNLKTREFIGFEALVRWEHPTRGLLSPFHFVPFAERTGHVRLIDLWMLDKACRMVKDFIPMIPDVFISVNLSGLHFADMALLESVRGILERHQVDPRHIKLEITESALIGDPDKAILLLRDLHALGFEIAMDDFGTGYSSLSYLHKFAIDTIKIDRSFINNILSDQKGMEIVQSITNLVKAFNQSVVAEGIEDESQAKALLEMGCDYGQGYLYSKPIPAEDMLDLCTRNIKASV